MLIFPTLATPQQGQFIFREMSCGGVRKTWPPYLWTFYWGWRKGGGMSYYENEGL